MAKIANYEKQLVRGTINMLLDRGVALSNSDVPDIEYAVSKYTGNMECDHRYDLEEFVKLELIRTMRAR